MTVLEQSDRVEVIYLFMVVAGNRIFCFKKLRSVSVAERIF